MLKFLLCVGCGGFIGAILRALVSIGTKRFGPEYFPVATFTVNIIGSLIIGFLMAYAEVKISPNFLKGFLLMGMLGSFTTFSTFAWENYLFLRNGQFIYALANIALSLICALIAARVGFHLFR